MLDQPRGVFLNARRRLGKDHGGGGLESRDEDAICGRWFIQVWYYDGQQRECEWGREQEVIVVVNP